MVAYLLIPFFMFVQNGVCSALQPEVVMETSTRGSMAWPVDQPVEATVHGEGVTAPFSNTICVFVEWAVGQTTGPEAAGEWMTFAGPARSRGDLTFRTADGRELRINPGGERFRLPATWSAYFGETKTGDEPEQVTSWRKHQKGPLTVREYCLTEGQKVTLTIREESQWLPPETENGPPVEDISRRVHIHVDLPGSEDTPQSIAGP